MVKPTSRNLWALVPLAMAAVVGASQRHAHADGAAQDKADAAARCANRLSTAILGTSPSASLLAAPDPSAQVDAMLATPEFQERFARFVNATFNRIPGNMAGADSAYWLTKHVLENGKPWKDLFVGPYDMTVDPNDDSKVTVTDNPDGLGYFRSDIWMKRYAGNEVDGLKISTAYRMMQNTIGLKLTAATTAPGQDISATGRQAQPCAGCHVEPWYALDKVAKVLTRRNGTGDGMTFDPPTGGAQQVLGGVTVSDDKQLVTALVESDAFRFRQCRLAFEYLYGRAEDTCEGPVFDQCMSQLAAVGTIQAAIGAIAKDASYCGSTP